MTETEFPTFRIINTIKMIDQIQKNSLETTTVHFFVATKHIPLFQMHQIFM